MPASFENECPPYHMIRRLTYPILAEIILWATPVLADQPTSIELLPGGSDVRLSTEARTGFIYKLQSSINLVDWIFISNDVIVEGGRIQIHQPVSSGKFYRFGILKQTVRFSPELFPFDKLEDFGIYLPGFEDGRLVMEPMEENQVGFSTEIHTDPENYIGVDGVFTYAVRPQTANTADFTITYVHYFHRNS